METFKIILSLWPFYIVAIVGAFMHIIKKWAKLEGKERTLDVSKWLKEHKWRTVLGLCLSMGGVIMLHSTDQLTVAAVLLVGYTGDSLLRKEKK